MGAIPAEELLTPKYLELYRQLPQTAVWKYMCMCLETPRPSGSLDKIVCGKVRHVQLGHPKMPDSWNADIVQLKMHIYTTRLQRQRLKDVADRLGLEYRTDAIGNVVIARYEQAYAIVAALVHLWLDG
jgi:hypothetical protein